MQKVKELPKKRSGLPRLSESLLNFCEHKPLRLYTINAIVLLGILFALFTFQGYSFICASDSFSQWYVNFCFLHDVVWNIISGKGFSFWSWQVGLGSDTLAFLSTFIFNPFTWLSAFFPKENMEACYNLVLLLELFFAGFSMCLFMIHRKFKCWICAVGALSYVFSYWILAVLTQFIFLFPPIMLPLVLMGVDWIFEKKSPALLMVSSAIVALNYLYCAYMIVIVCLIYVLVKTIFLSQEVGLKFTLKRVASIFGCTIVAMLIVSPLLAPCIYSYFQLVTSTGSDYQIWPCVGDIFSFFPSFASTQSSVSFNSYSYIGVFAIFVLLLPFVILRIRRKCTDSVMFLILAIIAFFPILRSVMNGFSYPTSRFCFTLVFFIIVSASHVLSSNQLCIKKHMKKIILFACILIAFETITITCLSNGKIIMLIYLAVNIVLALYCFRSITTGNKPSIKCITTSFAALAISLLLIYLPVGMDKTNIYLPEGQAERNMETSAFKNTSEISSSTFFRSDTAAHITKAEKNDYLPKQTINDGIYYNVPSISVYTSMLNGNVHKFNKAILNNMGYYIRSVAYSNDNRPGIDYLLGVKDFYLDKADAETSSAYANSYFTKSEDENKLTSKYLPSLGYVFNSTMSTDEFEKLNAVQKEQALLQTAVVDNENNLKEAQVNASNNVSAGERERGLFFNYC